LPDSAARATAEFVSAMATASAAELSVLRMLILRARSERLRR
jgi:hypothetical protein